VDALVAAAFGVAAFAMFAALPSRDYAAVDGGARALEVFRHTAGVTGGNNHLLYPAYVRGWTALLGTLGAPLGGPAEFLRAAQLLDAVSAAVAVAFLFLLARRTAGSSPVAMLVTVLYGCSRAFVLHATHGSEPMPGLAWSLVGAWLVVRGTERPSAALLAAGGAAQALAMASYQSMVLVAPALLVYAWLGGPREGRWWRAALFVAPALLATAILYAALYAASGTTSAAVMLARFLQLDGAPRVYAGLGLTKTLNLPLGLASAVAPVLPPGYAGLRSLLDGRVPRSWAAVAIGASLLAALGALGLCVAALRAARRSPPEGGVRAAWVAGVVAAAGVLVPLLWWNPLYDKLWLQPLALAALGVCALAGARPRSAAWRVAALVGALALVAVDLAGAVAAHRSPTPCLAQAREVARLVRPSDLVVRGWDPLSFAYGVFYEPRAHAFDLPQAAIASGAGTARRLDAERSAARERRGAVYYLGVFDADSTAWEAFLGRHAGLPWSALAGVRASAVPVARYACGGATLWLRRESP